MINPISYKPDAAPQKTNSPALISQQSSDYQKDKMFLDKNQRNSSFIELQCNILKNAPSPAVYIAALRCIQKSCTTSHDDGLCDIFLNFNIFADIIAKANSDDLNVSLSAFEFIINFTNKSDYFTQIFIENKLFDLILGVFQNQSNVDKLISALSILVNVSSFPIEIYIKRVWKIMPPKLYHTFLTLNNHDIILKCLKIAFCSLKNSSDTNIHQFITNELCQLLNSNDFTIVDYVFFCIDKYLDSPSCNTRFFTENNIQTNIEKFLTSNIPEFTIKSCLILGKMMEKKCIVSFKSSILFDLLVSENTKVQEMAYWCLSAAMAFRQAKTMDIIDFPYLVAHFSNLCGSGLLYVHFNAMRYCANIMFIIFQSIKDGATISSFVQNGAIALFIKYIQLEDDAVIEKSLRVLIELMNLAKINGDEDKIRIIFAENGGNEVLHEVLDRGKNVNIDRIIVKLMEMYSVSL